MYERKYGRPRRKRLSGPLGVAVVMAAAVLILAVVMAAAVLVLAVNVVLPQSSQIYKFRYQYLWRSRNVCYGLLAVRSRSRALCLRNF